jgi:Fic family protein
MSSMLTALIDNIKQKKAQLDRSRPMSAAALAQLQKHYDVELTYTSNAIEGNTLTLRETAEVIEHGITAGSPVVFPNPVKIPQLMEEFDTWLKAAPSDPVSAFEAHFRLTAIHPFGDGNGRTALMNLLLIRGGYPPLFSARRSQNLSR